MITEMAKKECKNALDNLLEVIDEKGLQDISVILKVIKRDFRPCNEKRLFLNISEVAFSMAIHEDECACEQRFKSMNDNLDRIEEFIAGSAPTKVTESLAPKKLILKVINGGLSGCGYAMQTGDSLIN